MEIFVTFQTLPAYSNLSLQLFKLCQLILIFLYAMKVFCLKYLQYQMIVYNDNVQWAEFF